MRIKPPGWGTGEVGTFVYGWDVYISANLLNRIPTREDVSWGEAGL